MKKKKKKKEEKREYRVRGFSKAARSTLNSGTIAAHCTHTAAWLRHQESASNINRTPPARPPPEKNAEKLKRKTDQCSSSTKVTSKGEDKKRNGGQ